MDATLHGCLLAPSASRFDVLLPRMGSILPAGACIVFDLCIPYYVVRTATVLSQHSKPLMQPSHAKSCPYPPAPARRYISIYRHLQRNPDNQLYPLFEYFENWCQDENRHGDFFTAVLKARPEMLQGFEGRLWSIFFCLSVYITMYLNDHSRDAFYSSLGLNTTQFNQHVIIETNKSTQRVFPCVPDVENPEFFKKMDLLVKYNTQLQGIDKMNVRGAPPCRILLHAVEDLPLPAWLLASPVVPATACLYF